MTSQLFMMAGAKVPQEKHHQTLGRWQRTHIHQVIVKPGVWSETGTVSGNT